MSNLVSVVIPVYNGAAYLNQCLESVFGQTHSNIEIIAVNDGSVDDSLQVLDKFACSRLHIIDQENSGSVGLARNAGLSVANGEYIAFLDQDDWWDPYKLEQQIKEFDNERIGLCHTATSYFDDKTSSLVPPRDPTIRPHEIAGFNCLPHLLRKNSICNSSVMISRKAYLKVGGCDARIEGNTVQDYDLWLRIALSGFGMAFVDQPLTFFRLHDKQGHNQRELMLRQEIKVLRSLELKAQASWAASKRIAELFDELAVNCYEHGQFWLARKHFASAARSSMTLRSIGRLAASLLPHSVVAPIRRRRAKSCN